MISAFGVEHGDSIEKKFMASLVEKPARLVNRVSRVKHNAKHKRKFDKDIKRSMASAKRGDVYWPPEKP